MHTSQQSRQRLESIKNTTEAHSNIIAASIDSIPIGVCITDRHGHYVSVNTAYCSIYGYSQEDLIGQHFTVVVQEEDKAALSTLHDDFISRKRELQGQWKVRNKEGHTFMILSNAAYLTDQDTGESQKMTFVVNITDAQHAHEELQATVAILQKKLQTQDVAVNMANHDVKNNIVSILSVVGILLNETPTEKQKKWLNILKNLSEKAMSLLGTTSDYERMEQGNYVPNVSEFDLVQTINEEIASLDRLIDKKKLRVKLNFQSEGNGLLIRADKFYMERMLHNLLQNAIEASPEGKAVSIHLVHDDLIRMNIHNEGAIPADIQSHFFEKYITSGKPSGTGLGTYIVKLIVEMHHGSVTFQSSEEAGTHLYLSFPGQLLVAKKSSDFAINQLK